VLALQKFERENKHYKDALRILTESVDKIVKKYTCKLFNCIGKLATCLEH
jgi:hypothetical protein